MCEASYIHPQRHSMLYTIHLTQTWMHFHPYMEEGITLGDYYFIPAVSWYANRINMSTAILCEAFFVNLLWVSLVYTIHYSKDSAWQATNQLEDKLIFQVHNIFSINFCECGESTNVKPIISSRCVIFFIDLSNLLGHGSFFQPACRYEGDFSQLPSAKNRRRSTQIIDFHRIKQAVSEWVS